jgi:riboflavin kinase/FMN adenylyltransferase
MRVIQNIGELETEGPLALTAGSFDGVHLGHQALIADAVHQAKEAGGEAWLLTFNPHPARLLAPTRAPRLLMTNEQQHQVFSTLGLHGCIELPFGQQLAETEAEVFIETLAQQIPGLLSLTVGPNWTFGYHARGNTVLLSELAEKHDFQARVLTPIEYKGQLISSSRIRSCIENGALEEATQMLGRPYVLSGVVIRGKQEGHELGFPTANVQFRQECEPPDGIFACTAVQNGKEFPGAGYFLHSEKDESQVFEVHLIGEDLDLYGQVLEVALLHQIRNHESFSSKTALIEQIQADIAAISAWLKSRNSQD